jgi:hypothetical protein
MQLTPNYGVTGMQLKNGQGGMLQLPGAANFRSMATTMMESSPNKKTLRGHTKMNSTFDSRPTRNSSHFQTAGTANNGINGMNKTFNTFMSPANKTMKDAFFNLPHMN